MNNSFAESISTSYLNILLSKTHRIDTSDIHRGEKGMCWDGSLIIFDDKGTNKRNIYGKIPIQIKSIHSSGKSNKFSIRKDDLLSYQKEGWLLYFYIKLDNNDNASIFYLPLQLLDITNMLKKFGDKNTKSFVFKPFPCEKDEIVSLMTSFIDERNRHMQLIPNVASTDDLVKIKGKDVKLFFDTKIKRNATITELVKAINNQNPYIRYHSEDINIDFPVDRIGFIKELSLPTRKSIGVNNKIYFSNLILSSDGNTFSLSYKNIFKLCFVNNKITINYKIEGEYRDRLNLVSFIHDLAESKCFSVDKTVINITEENAKELSKKVDKFYRLYIKLESLLKFLHIFKEPVFDTNLDEDAKTVITLYDSFINNKKCQLNTQNNSGFATIKFLGLSVYVPYMKVDDGFVLLDWTKLKLNAKAGDEELTISIYYLLSTFSNNPFEYIDNIDFNSLANELFATNINKDMKESIIIILNNMISYYEKTKMKHIINTARDIANRLIDMFPQEKNKIEKLFD